MHKHEEVSDEPKMKDRLTSLYSEKISHHSHKIQGKIEEVSGALAPAGIGSDPLEKINCGHLFLTVHFSDSDTELVT